MHGTIDDQMVDFFQSLFEAVFSVPFRARIKERLKRNLVIRQVEEAADAASQSLTRFFRNEQLTETQVASVLESLSSLAKLLSLDRIGNASVTPESLVSELVPELPCRAAEDEPAVGAIYREAMHSVVQVLLLVGPVMAEWQKLSFSTTFELPRRVAGRLNQISEQLGAFGRSGREARDENYELTYRDFLLQRFHRIEAGTVRMTTKLAVDLSELFVTPRLLPRLEPRELHDERWSEVIALYCGLAPAPAARTMIERLIAQDDSRKIGPVLTEAYHTAGPEIRQDQELRTRITERLARVPFCDGVLNSFPAEEVAPIANASIGTTRSDFGISEASAWLQRNRRYVDRALLLEKISRPWTESPNQRWELIYVAFSSLDAEDVARLADDAALLSSQGPTFATEVFSSQASHALLGLAARVTHSHETELDSVLVVVLDHLPPSRLTSWEIGNAIRCLNLLFRYRTLPADYVLRRELAARSKALIQKGREVLKSAPTGASPIFTAETLDELIALVNKLDPADAAPSVGVGSSRPAPRPRRRSRRRQDEAQ